jgi:hypothetical protein
MTKTSSDATRWLAGYLATGDATPESRVFRAARQAGLDHREVRRAAKAIGVEMFPGAHTGWWRLPRDGGPSNAPPPSLSNPHPRPAIAGGGRSERDERDELH